MIIVTIFAFLGGIITVLSPCILPLLPIILSSSTGKRKPIGVVTGFIASFTFFTLALSSIVRATGIPAESLRNVSIIILFLFGLTLLVPKLQLALEVLFARLTNFSPKQNPKTGFTGGLLVGLSLGLLWTPCVGPILASVITLALSGSVTSQAVLITLAYATGTSIPMFLIMRAGSTALQRVPWLVKNTSKIQKAFGVLTLLTAIGIYFQIERRFQNYILDLFPNYADSLTKFEKIDVVKKELEK